LFDVTYALFMFVVLAFMVLPFAVLVKPGLQKMWRGFLVIFALPLMTAYYGTQKSRVLYTRAVRLPILTYAALLLLLAFNLSIIALGFFDTGLRFVGFTMVIVAYLLLLHCLFYRRGALD
jgi:hypothetical protein